MVKILFEYSSIDFDEYREPMVGGGSFFIFLKQKFPTKKYWINDLHKNLYLFWKFTKKDVKSLVNKIIELKNQFDNGKELYYYLTKNIEVFDDLSKAAAFFILNRITFSGTAESGGYSEAAYKHRFTDSSIERVLQLSNLLDSNVKITNYDYSNYFLQKGKMFLFI